LLQQGHQVRVFDNFSTGRRINLEEIQADIELMEADLRDVEALKRAVQGIQHIFHIGALPSVQRSVEDPFTTHDVNVTGTLNLLLAARDAGVERLVFSSSSSVYGDTPTLPKQEDMLPQPLSPYALSKLAGEHYLRIFHQLYGIKTFSLRYFNVFGPRQDPASDYAAVIPLFVDALCQRRPLYIDGDGGQTRDFTFVADVVLGNMCCMTAPDQAVGGVYNLAWGYRTAIKELAQQIADQLAVPLEAVHRPSRAGDVRDSQADSTRARTLLGWDPQVPFEEGLRRTIEWFRSNPA
jgi:nucleoside-diphosphate-sugar epimerase